MKEQLNDEFLTVEKETQQPNWNWFGGVMLIALGAIFLMGQAGIEILGVSPWRLFALLPVLFVLLYGWRRYVENGRRFSREIFFMLFFGLFPFAYIIAPIFNISVGFIWPVMLIGMGLGIVAFRSQESE